MKKSILFINQSSGYLMIDIVNAHVPYYDEIILFTGFLNPRETPLHENVKVKMGVSYIRLSAFRRLSSWLVFWIQSLYYIFLKYRDHKIYFVSNPPLNIFSAKFTKRDFAFLVFDIYPEALSKYNYLSRNNKLYHHWEKANNIVYNNAKRLFTISHGMKKGIMKSNVAEEKIDIVPIWTNNAFFKDIPSNQNEFLKKFEIDRKFIVGYSGNLGKSHPIERITEVAKKLEHQKDIIFLIIGDGDKRDLLLQKKSQMSLKNLKILDYQPTNLFPHVLAAIDIGIITLDAKASHLNVPSKTFDLMSVGKPLLCISSESSELSKLIRTYKIGENFSEDQIDEMCQFILYLKNNSQVYNKMKKLSKQASLNYSSQNAKQMILK
jgi:glycosyltransferase involved in cell wall biosynthesis